MVWRHGKSHSPTNESLCDPKTAAVFKSERNTLGHDTRVLGMSVLSGTTLDWPGFVVLTFFTVWYWLLGCYHPSIHVKKEATNFFLLPSQMLMPGAGVAKGTHQDRSGNP